MISYIFCTPCIEKKTHTTAAEFNMYNISEQIKQMSE